MYLFFIYLMDYGLWAFSCNPYELKQHKNLKIGWKKLLFDWHPLKYGCIQMFHHSVLCHGKKNLAFLNRRFANFLEKAMGIDFKLKSHKTRWWTFVNRLWKFKIVTEWEWISEVADSWLKICFSTSTDLNPWTQQMLVPFTAHKILLFESSLDTLFLKFGQVNTVH